MNIKTAIRPSPLATRLESSAVRLCLFCFSAIWLMIPAIIAIEKMTANMIK